MSSQDTLPKKLSELLLQDFGTAKGFQLNFVDFLIVVKDKSTAFEAANAGIDAASFLDKIFLILIIFQSEIRKS